MTEIPRVFTVDGQPFFPVGGQARNSSGYNDAESDTAFRALKLINGNTLEIPVYWCQVEPAEGQFDFASVDALYGQAQRYEVKLVLLWFGTWKNGDMDYAPAWVKTDPARFARVQGPLGGAVWGLSPHCQATLEADRRAFAALCEHLAARQQTYPAVVAVQVENEPGILGSDRDYGPAGQAAFESPVPDGVLAAMRAAGCGPVYDLWQAAGGKAAGSWPELFGAAAGELMTAWAIATYIDQVAAEGKARFEVPMYANVWLGENGWRVPGESYPSGGAVSKVLDIYKWCTPHLDLIAPDIYIADARGYEAVCAAYARPDNPLFVPESAPGGSNPWLMFRAVADYNAIGYSFFAIEHLIGPDGGVRPELAALAGSFRSLAAAAPLLLQYQGTGRVHAVVQDEDLGAQSLALDGWLGQAEFGDISAGALMKDWRHLPPAMAPIDGGPARRGRGLVIQAAQNEFYLVGAAYRLVLRPPVQSAAALDIIYAREHLLRCQAHYVSVDEGHFDVSGEFVVDRHRNGDEVDGGVWVEADNGVVRVVMCD
jgi:beta-galactosidase GanA